MSSVDFFGRDAAREAEQAGNERLDAARERADFFRDDALAFAERGIVHQQIASSREFP